MSLFIFPRWANKTKHIAGVALGRCAGLLDGVRLVRVFAEDDRRRIHAEPAGAVQPRAARGRARHRLPLLPQHRRESRHARRSRRRDVHELPQDDPHQEPEARSGARERRRPDKPIEWLKVHDLPDYVYFNHSAHVTRGVGCVSCHGRVDQMEEVYQDEPLSMGWCLDCHRAPGAAPAPAGDGHAHGLEAAEQRGSGRLRHQSSAPKNHINPPTDCSTCHR